ncbi:MAG: glycosyltransferase, partial [bacterium]
SVRLGRGDATGSGGVAAELCIADWPTPDQNVARWICTATRLRARVVRMSGPFSRGRGRNGAARIARGAVLFFMDADMLCVPRVIERGLEVVREGKVFFPGYVRQAGPNCDKYSDGNGTGNAIISRSMYAAAEGYPEYEAYGGEDIRFCRQFDIKGLAVREKVEGFRHQWHPKPGIGEVKA